MMGKSVMLLGKVVEYCILDDESPVTKVVFVFLAFC